MRILQVRFKNLNSLVGEWHIDFTHPAYDSNGIFAITGPTGAGKTTILDAICLALYGRTPRLDKVNQSTNEIMSRQTAECFSEVIFETKEGRFCCVWSQRRARKKTDGALQPARHEISEADSGKVLASKTTETAGQIEARTGMDFDRFTRSILLAQGAFSAFLGASEDQRSPILEQITGTEIYSRISIRVHERLREEREKLQRLRDKTNSIEVLQPEEEQKIARLLATEKTKEHEFSLKAASTEEALSWLKEIDALKNEMTALDEESTDLQNHISAFQPDLEKLKKAVLADSLDGRYAHLSSVRKQQTEGKNALKTQEESLPELQLAVHRQTELIKQIEKQLAQKKDDLKKAMPVLQKVRFLDKSISEQSKVVKASEDEYKKAVSSLLITQKNREEQQNKLAKANQAKEAIENYFREYAQDEQLISHLSGIKAQLGVLAARQNEISQKEKEQKESEKTLKQLEKLSGKLQKQRDTQKKELKSVSEKLQQDKTELDRLLGDRLLREYRTEKENLLREKVFLAKIAELEDHRAKLEDGIPCPLCGAMEHPYAKGNIPVSDETDIRISQLTGLISQAEDLEALVKKEEAAENQARHNLITVENQLEVSDREKSSAEKSLEEKKGVLDSFRTGFLEQKQNVIRQLIPFGITGIPKENIFSLSDLLESRLNQWQKKDRQGKEIEKQIGETDSEIRWLDSIIAVQQNSLSEKKVRLENLQQELNLKNLERSNLFGDKNPDREEQLLNQAISDSESGEKLSRERFGTLQEQFNTAKGSIEILKGQIDKRESELKKMEEDFALAISAIGFPDEESFLKARLTSDEKEALSAKEKALNDRQISLKARRGDREVLLASELEKKVTDRSLEETASLLYEHKQAVEDARNRVAALQHQLNENLAAVEKIRESQTETDAQIRECGRWENLHELIGSADGKKYRNFAQGLTFEIMVHYANQQLLKMTDRYLLVRDELAPLELNIIDNYQAGEIRTTKNLSGGESFIVSLALALGLSRMSSRNVRVDSLFLDEGFGTLDENALDTALETLSGLQQEGKLIGIISHVSSLKERIGTQIVVEPLPGGKSRLSGPGIA